jgi:hypothetical protein
MLLASTTVPVIVPVACADADTVTAAVSTKAESNLDPTRTSLDNMNLSLVITELYTSPPE